MDPINHHSYLIRWSDDMRALRHNPFAPPCHKVKHSAKHVFSGVRNIIALLVACMECKRNRLGKWFFHQKIWVNTFPNFASHVKTIQPLFGVASLPMFCCVWPWFLKKNWWQQLFILYFVTCSACSQTGQIFNMLLKRKNMMWYKKMQPTPAENM